MNPALNSTSTPTVLWCACLEDNKRKKTCHSIQTHFFCDSSDLILPHDQKFSKCNWEVNIYNISRGLRYIYTKILILIESFFFLYLEC